MSYLILLEEQPGFFAFLKRILGDTEEFRRMREAYIDNTDLSNIREIELNSKLYMMALFSYCQRKCILPAALNSFKNMDIWATMRLERYYFELDLSDDFDDDIVFTPIDDTQIKEVKYVSCEEHIPATVKVVDVCVKEVKYVLCEEHRPAVVNIVSGEENFSEGDYEEIETPISALENEFSFTENLITIPKPTTIRYISIARYKDRIEAMSNSDTLLWKEFFLTCQLPNRYQPLTGSLYVFISNKVLNDCTVMSRVRSKRCSKVRLKNNMFSYRVKFRRFVTYRGRRFYSPNKYLYLVFRGVVGNIILYDVKIVCQSLYAESVRYQVYKSRKKI